MSSFPARTTLKTALGVALAGSVTATLAAVTDAERRVTESPRLELAASSNPATPGNFTGPGFDQCNAPSQRAMDRWMARSPFTGVGIYISGYSRGCREQPNLTPAWVSKQLRSGWRLLPITLGPQASCSTHFPRYGHDKTINSTPGKEGKYWYARKMGLEEAAKTVRAAQRLGLSRGSVMYYDLEAFNESNGRCRESALYFLSSWTSKLRALGYKSGVYSSAASGIKALDDARVNRPGKFTMPDQIWIADWDGKANTSSRFVRESGWQPHRRVKQYRGGHNETWGGVTINIDRNWLDVGKGTTAPPVFHCGTPKKYVKVSSTDYVGISRTTTNRTFLIRAAKCLLKERYSFSGDLNGTWGPGMTKAVNDFRRKHGWGQGGIGAREWVALLSAKGGRTAKSGSGGEYVRNLQRALNAALPAYDLNTRGFYTAATRKAVIRYQRHVGLSATGIADANVWQKLRAGAR